MGPLDPGGPWHLSSLVQWVLRHWLARGMFPGFGQVFIPRSGAQRAENCGTAYTCAHTIWPTASKLGVVEHLGEGAWTAAPLHRVQWRHRNWDAAS